MTGCLNGGSCLFGKKKETFSCSCKLPWSGDKCEVEGGKIFSLLVWIVIYSNKTFLGLIISL